MSEKQHETTEIPSVEPSTVEQTHDETSTVVTVDEYEELFPELTSEENTPTSSPKIDTMKSVDIKETTGFTNPTIINGIKKNYSGFFKKITIKSIIIAIIILIFGFIIGYIKGEKDEYHRWVNYTNNSSSHHGVHLTPGDKQYFWDLYS